MYEKEDRDSPSTAAKAGKDLEIALIDPTAMADRAMEEVEARRVEGEATARARRDRQAVREDREAIVEGGSVEEREVEKEELEVEGLVDVGGKKEDGRTSFFKSSTEEREERVRGRKRRARTRFVLSLSNLNNNLLEKPTGMAGWKEWNQDPKSVSV